MSNQTAVIEPTCAAHLCEYSDKREAQPRFFIPCEWPVGAPLVIAGIWSPHLVEVADEKTGQIYRVVSQHAFHFDGEDWNREVSQQEWHDWLHADE